MTEVTPEQCLSLQCPLDSDKEPCSRVLTLPRPLLQDILHRAGRPCRRACRTFLDVLGPLEGGLYLEHFASDLEFSQLIGSLRPGAVHHIHTLHLQPSPPHDSATSSQPTLSLSVLAATFPSLRALRLEPPIILTSSVLHSLGPLAPGLTRLTVHAGKHSTDHLPTVAALATTLTSLRSLTLTSRLYITKLLSALRPLAPTLQYLDHTLLDATYTYCNAADILLFATPFTQLTHLAFDAGNLYGHEEARARLFAALPRLKGLRFFGGAAQLRHAAQLPGAFLHPSEAEDAEMLCLPREAVAQGRSLPTHRSLGFGSAPLRFTRQVEESLALLAGTLTSLTCNVQLRPLSTLLPLSRLTGLESLCLASADLFCPPKPAAGKCMGKDAACGSAIAAALTRLTSLTLGTCMPLTHERELVARVAARGALRHLRLGYWHHDCSTLLAPLARSLVRLQLPWNGVLAATAAVAHLQALRSLHVEYDEAAWLADEDATGSLFVQDASTSQAAAVAKGGPVQVCLPPGLRQLCLSYPYPLEIANSIAGGLEDAAQKEAARLQEAALLAAARRQDCVVRGDGVALATMSQPMWGRLGSVLPDEYDDCHGYRDGAAAAFIEARLQT